MDNMWRSEVQHFVANLLNREKMKTFLDLGCGHGKDLKFFKDQFGKDLDCQFIGIDKLEMSITSACEKYSEEGVEFYTMDVANGLDFTDDKFDIVYSMNVVECIKYKFNHKKEIHRVLKPGGQVVCCHCDWDSVIYNGEDKELIKEILGE